MATLWPVENFSVEPTSIINGDINAYNFTLSTKVSVKSGDTI
jgi:hypothetical protein